MTALLLLVFRTLSEAPDRLRGECLSMLNFLYKNLLRTVFYSANSYAISVIRPRQYGRKPSGNSHDTSASSDIHILSHSA